MTLGDKLSRLRKENNYTQEQFADILEVSRQTVSKWESDIAYPETDKLIRISTLYHCSLDYLLKDTVEEMPSSAPAQRGETSEKVSHFLRNILRFAPLALYSLWAPLLWAFYAAPLLNISDNNLYQWFGNSLVYELQPTINAFISFGVISTVYIAVLALVQRFANKKVNFIANLGSLALQIAVFITAMSLIGVCKSVGLVSGKVVIVVATLTGIFFLFQAPIVAFDFYFNHDKGVAPREKKQFVRKTLGWIKLHKVIAIVIACVLVVGIALAVVLPLTVGNIFSTNRVSRIQLGDSRDQVIKLLGKPMDIDTDKLAEMLGDENIEAFSKENFYYYCSPKAERLLNDAFRLLDEVEKLNTTQNVGDAKVILAKLNKLQENFNKIEFKYIEVTFERGAVVGVEYNSKFSNERANDVKWKSESRKQSVKLIPDEIPYGETPYSAELYAQTFYEDGSYKLSRIENVDAYGNAQNGWNVSWSDQWGSYAKKINESADKGSVVERGDVGDYVSYNVSNINVNGKEGYSLRILGRGALSDSAEYGWSKYADGVLEVTVNDGITNVPNGAFKNFSNLTTVILPSSITKIGDSAFYCCEGINTIDIARVTQIGNSAFYGCSLIRGLVFSDNLTTIGAHAFEGCATLINLTIPVNVAYVGDAAFAGCTSLRSVTWNAALPKVGSNLFSNTPSLTTVTIEWDAKEVPEGLFSGCKSITNVTIVGGRTEWVRARAFENCTSLKNIQLGGFLSSVELDEYSFRGCTSLESVVMPYYTSAYRKGVFQNCTSLRTVKVATDGTFRGDNLREIQEYAFAGCKSLIEVYSSSDLFERVGSYAFYNCISLTEIRLWSYRFDEIAPYAFAGCTSLSTVVCYQSNWTVKLPSASEGIDIRSSNPASLLTGTYCAYTWTTN